MTLPIFPSQTLLPGLGYNVKWSPVYFNQSQKTMNGTSVDISLSPYPLYNFELTFPFLRAAPTKLELQTLMGIYAMSSGSLGRFLFQNPDDFSVTHTSAGYGQTTMVGDGTTNAFTIARSIGTLPYVAAPDPIGQVITVSGVYLNGVLQGSGFTISTTVPGLNGITFSTAPGAGVTIGLDMTYYYYCKFSDDTNTFEKFLDQIWQIQSLKFMSCLAFG